MQVGAALDEIFSEFRFSDAQHLSRWFSLL